MIHLYCGDGKGQTTAAIGLAMRSAGRGNRVVVAQFLKNADSGERAALSLLPSILLLDAPEIMKFVFQMTPEEKKAERERQTALFDAAVTLASRERAGLLVLDEMCSAVSTGMVSLERVTEFLDHLPAGLEVVLTGRDPAPELERRADYITEMRKCKHPYDRGVAPRLGVEW